MTFSTFVQSIGWCVGALVLLCCCCVFLVALQFRFNAVLNYFFVMAVLLFYFDFRLQLQTFHLEAGSSG